MLKEIIIPVKAGIYPDFGKAYMYTKRNFTRLSSIIIFLLFMSKAVAGPVNITFWHSMSGQLGEVVNNITNNFNHSQNLYRIIPIYKGEYVETLTNTVSAFRAGRQPDLVQIFEVGAADMMFPQGAIVPLHQILIENHQENLENQLLSTVRSYYSDNAGHLVAIPFNSSSPVMYYNKDAFTKVGIKVNNSPLTWPAVASIGLKLRKAGYSCGFTTSWPSWIQLESFCAWHNLPYASNGNGFKGTDTKILFNSPLVFQHLSYLASLQKQNIFVYGGRNDDGVALFTSQKCPILFESSGSRPGLVTSVNFKVGIAPLPYWPEAKDAPQNTSIGGGAIWVMQGHTKIVDQGIAKFVSYFFSTPVQVQWQAQTGYIPLTQEAVTYLRESGYYRKHPDAEIAVRALTNKLPTEYSRGIRLGNYTLIRQNNDTALEEIWSGKKSAEEAISDVIKKDNLLLRHFKQSVDE